MESNYYSLTAGWAYPRSIVAYYDFIAFGIHGSARPGDQFLPKNKMAATDFLNALSRDIF